jgi:hypothetical protein
LVSPTRFLLTKVGKNEEKNLFGIPPNMAFCMTKGKGILEKANDYMRAQRLPSLVMRNISAGVEIIELSTDA